MLASTISTLLNEQINKEMYSAYLYLDISNHFVEQGLNGFASWFTLQAQEEMEHAGKFITYLQDNNEHITLTTLNAPELEKNEIGAILEAVLKHEEYITSTINTIYSAALAEKDYRTMKFLDWFITEQLEEEKNANDLISDFALYGKDNMVMLDQKLGDRQAE